MQMFLHFFLMTNQCCSFKVIFMHISVICTNK